MDKENKVLQRAESCIQNAVSWVKQKKLPFLRLLGLSVACLCIMVCASIYAFNAYANELKDHFELTQFQVELISSLASLGNNFALPAGLMQEKFGHRPTLVFALAITFTFLMLLWSAQYYIHVYIQHTWLLYIYFFLIGFGAICGFIAVYPVVLLNFRAKQRGCITSLLGTSLAIGPGVFAAIYGAAFLHWENGLWGFFLFIAIAFFVAFSLSMICVQKVPRDMESLSERSALMTSQSIDNVEHAEEQQGNVTGWALLREPDFYPLMGSFVFSVSIQFSYLNNIPTFLKSFEAQGDNTLFTVLAPVVSSVAKLVLGVLSDFTLSKIPRVAYQLASNTLQTVFLLFCIFYMENIHYLLVTTIILSIGSGVMTTQTASRIADSFGTKHFSRNFGFSFIGVGIGIFCLQLIFGALYDAHVDSDQLCRGKDCFIWSFVIFFAFSFFSALLDARGLYLNLKRTPIIDGRCV